MKKKGSFFAKMCISLQAQKSRLQRINKTIKARKFFWHKICMDKKSIIGDKNMALSIFTPSVTGMNSQSHALETVSTNIANINTVGYKSSETMFYTLLGSTPVVKGNAASGLQSTRTDINGVGYYDRTFVTSQGQVVASNNSFDVAINGNSNAFFTVRDSYSGDEYYTRAGNFRIQLSGGVPYLVANNGMRVQGYPANEDGSFGSSIEDIVLEYPEKIPANPTSKVQIGANVPADGVENSSYGIMIYGPNDNGANMSMVFHKVEGKANAWTLSFEMEGATVTTAEPIEVQFSSDGKLLSPTDFDIDVAWADGSSNTIAMNIENMTQYAGSSGIANIKQDGKEGGAFKEASIGKNGIVSALYSNGQTVNLGKLALSSFAAPDNLTAISGTLFEANGASGNAVLIEDGGNYLQPQALEQSTTNVEKEFSKMVVIQRAYGMNSSSFSVADEMLQVVRDLKS